MRKKYVFVILLFSLMVSWLSGSVYSESGLEEVELEIDTSIILLTISADGEKVFSDSFFEILYFSEEDYYLLPLNLLTSYFEMEINLDRTNKMLTVKNPENNREVILDLKKSIYIGEKDWKGPLLYAGDFFVSPNLLVYLFDVNIKWDPSYQELEINGDYFSKEKKEETDSTKKGKEEEEKEGEQEERKIITGNDFSLGSVHYKVELDYRSKSSQGDKLSGSQYLNLYGRLKDWAISIGEKGSTNFTDNESEYEFSLLKAKYDKNNRLIIIGDTNLDLENTLEENKLRGFYYSFPAKKISKVISYTSISGKAENGDKVTLYVNGKKTKGSTIDGSESYYFDKIQLLIHRLNILKIVIEKTNGETKEIIKKIAASPRIYTRETKEFEFFGGLYRDDNVNDWQGKLMGMTGNYALSGDVSCSLELVGYEADEEQGEVLTVVDAGLAFILGDQTIATLDWLFAGEEKEIENGGKSSLLYAMESGYLKGLVFLIPENVADRTPEEEGKGGRISALFSLSPNWDLLPSCYYIESLAVDSIYKKRNAAITLVYKNGWRLTNSVTGKIEQIEDFYEISNSGIEIPGKNKRHGIILSSSRYGKGFRGKGELQVFKNNIELKNNIKLQYSTLELDGNLYKKIFNSLAFTNNTEASSYYNNGKFNDIDLDINNRIKWNITKKTSLSLGSKLVDQESEGVKETSYDLDISHYLGRASLISFALGYTESSTGVDYLSYEVRTYHLFEGIDSNLNFHVRYAVPREESLDLNKQLTFGIDYLQVLANNREIEISAGKNQKAFLDSTEEYYVTAAVSQAFGFAGNSILTQRYNDTRHRSVIAGFVYLDENNNGQLDKGEKVIPDIKMRMGNLIGRTDEDGQYQIKLMFPGVYKLNFDYNSLIADYTPITQEKTIRIRENENLFVNFGLTINGSVSGKIYIDKNANGIMDNDEIPLQWVGVSLNGKRVDYTDKRGEFYFENVPLGEYEITIVKESLPAEVIPAAGYSYKVKILENKLDIQDFSIPVVYQF